ncbi:MAG: hypothetical protein SGILL_007374 [Bacillariaceae sp.]
MNVIHQDDDHESQAVGNGEPFPLKLHALLEETEKRGFTSIISWEGPNAFQVHKKKLFAEMVMPSYFDSTNYKTFQRNLNLWGFRTCSKGPMKGQCSHALFVRGKPDLCRSMVRVRNKTNPPDRFYQQQQQQQQQEQRHQNASSVAAAIASPEAGTNRPDQNVVDTSLLQSLITAASAPAPFPSAVPSSGMPGLGAALSASLNVREKQQQHPSMSSASLQSPSGTQSLAPTLATLLQSFAVSQSGMNSGLEQNPRALPKYFQQPQPQQQQTPQLTPQMLQLLALQQQFSMPSTGTATDAASTAGASQSPFQQAMQHCQPVQMQPLSSMSGSSDTSSSRGGASKNDTNTTLATASSKPAGAASNKKQADGSRVVACRARGMDMEHNIHTAFFRITSDMAHGADLVCSYPQCRNGGVKFLYCKFCDDAIARRSFRSQHLHMGETLLSKRSSAKLDGSAEELKMQTRKLRKIAAESTTSSARGANPDNDTRVAVATESFSNQEDITVSESSQNAGDKAEEPVLAVLRKSWEDLLEQRVEHTTGSEVSPWLMRVLALSDQYASQYNQN